MLIFIIFFGILLFSQSIDSNDTFILKCNNISYCILEEVIVTPYVIYDENDINDMEVIVTPYVDYDVEYDVKYDINDIEVIVTPYVDYDIEYDIQYYVNDIEVNYIEVIDNLEVIVTSYFENSTTLFYEHYY